MRYEEMMLDWLMADECLEDLEVEKGLSQAELCRLEFFAEHPELADPLIWFLPERGLVKWGGEL